MNFTNKITQFFAVSVFLLSTCSFAAQEKTITYKNQRGSTMTLTWHQQKGNTGTLSGTFTTAVASCKEVINQPVPLTGYYNGNAVAIVINYPKCTGVVAITGNLTEDNQGLKTLWLVARKVSDPVSKNWDSNVIGSDYFAKS